MSQLYYEDEIKALNKSRLKYLVVGGIAANLYGLYRLTQDLDVMIDIPEEKIEQFEKVMDSLGYKTRVPIEKRRTVIAIAFVNNKDEYKRIDVFLKNPIDFEQAYRKRKLKKLGKVNVSCVSLEDLIKMKEKSGRDRDLIDIGYLKKYIKEGKISGN